MILQRPLLSPPHHYHYDTELTEAIVVGVDILATYVTAEVIIRAIVNPSSAS